MSNTTVKLVLVGFPYLRREGHVNIAGVTGILIQELGFEMCSCAGQQAIGLLAAVKKVIENT